MKYEDRTIPILELPSYEDLLKENLSFLTDRLPNLEINHNSDISVVVEAFTYRELYLRAMVNQKIKNMMPQYAVGRDLDEFVFAFYGGVKRLKGAFPYTSFLFELNTDIETTVPNGSILTNSSGERGRVVEDVYLSKKTNKKYANVELLEEIEESSVELNFLEKFQSISVRQTGSFSNGAVAETDERFRERALFSLNRFSTAGSKESYYYHILESDVRVDTVYIYSPLPGVVRVVLDNFLRKIDKNILAKIEKHLSDDKVRPLTDKVEVVVAKSKEITIKADVKLFDLNKKEDVHSSILNNFLTNFKISEDLTMSDIVQRMHVDDVYSVTVVTPSKSLMVSEEERIVIKEVICVYSRAEI